MGIDKDIVEGKRLGAIMDESKIEEIARREIAKENIEGHIAGPKTEEGKKRALRNLRPRSSMVEISEAEIPIPDIEELPDKERIPLYYLGSYKILNEEEQRHYLKKWFEYTEDFEFNNSSDEGQLNSVIMEEIIYNRLIRSQLTNPREDLSKQISECTKRHSDALKSLGIARTQRLGSKAGKEENIATLIQQFDKDKLMEVTKKEDDMLCEEEQLMLEKRKQFEEELKEISLLESQAPDKDEVIRPPVSSEDLKAEMGKTEKGRSVSDSLRTILDEAALQ
jgi:hypothetical protein